MTAISLTTSHSVLHAQQAAAKKLLALLRLYDTQPILLLLSGGSSLSVLSHVDVGQITGTALTIGVVDERYGVEKDDQNFDQLMQTDFARRLCHLQARCLDPQISLADNVVDAGRRYDQSIKEYYATHPSSVTITLLGIGPDGHTAGVMPFRDDVDTFAHLFVDTNAEAVGYDAGRKNPLPLRVSVTLQFLRTRATAAVVYASGDDKKPALERMLATDDALHEVPARIVHHMQDVALFTDQRL